MFPGLQAVRRAEIVHDVEIANRIEKELLEKENMTLLTVTHRIKDGLNECYDRVLRIEAGRLTLQQQGHIMCVN